MTQSLRRAGAFLLAAGSALPLVCTWGCSLGRGEEESAREGREQWNPLATQTWSLEPGSEAYLCTRIVLEREVWVRGFRALAPPGTHHVVLTLGDEGAPEGDYDCPRGNLDPRVLYADGSSPQDWTLPHGVAYHLRAGQTLELGLHVLDWTSVPRGGTSGVLVDELDPRDVVSEAELLVVGATDFAIPAHATGYPVESRCTLGGELTVLAAMPVMHRFGAHQRVVSSDGGREVVLHDSLFTFGEEKLRELEPVTLHAGEEVAVRCTFNNVTVNAVRSGPEVDDERCEVSLTVVPKGGALIRCD